MKQHIKSAPNFWRLSGIICLCICCMETQAGIFSFLKKKKKPVKTEIKKSDYEKALTGHPVETARSSFISLHKTNGTLLIELPQASLGRDMLLGATITSASNPRLSNVGFKNSNLIHVRFVQKDSSVVMQLVNGGLLRSSGFVVPGREEKKSFENLDFYRFPIKGFSKRDSSVLFDASSFFLKEDRYFPFVENALGAFKATSKINDAMTRITSLKAFDKNASVVQERSYTVNIEGRGNQKSITGYPLTIGINFTLALLPDTPMTPRLSDSRLGVFLLGTQKENNGKIEKAFVMKRWRVEPKDTAAYSRGELSDPVKPIVFYVENTFPEGWKNAIRKGVLRWNKAFERIGFKNVMQVHDFPQNDPAFDPDNFEYSCIRYLPTSVENAMGPSWVDPRSGEIVNATVLVYNDIINVIDNWRFVQTAQNDPLVRQAHLPDSIAYESLEYVIAHEVGHTLGFMHNMAASAALPTDSLRSPDFTHKYGTTASIMDYARYNYVAQPEDKGVALTPPFLGVYDYFLVEQAYRYFPHSKGYEDDFRRLSALMEKHAGDPFYRYGLQQMRTRIDPSAIEEDLGDNPVKASEYGMKNLHYILSHLDTWIPDGEDTKRKGELYDEILRQAYGYIRNVYANVWGVYLYQTSESSGLPRYKVVPREAQKASAQWLLRQARTFSALGNEEIERKLPAAGNRPFKLMERDVQAMAMMAASKLGLSYYLDSASYAPLEYMEDIYQNIFEKTEAGNEELTPADKSMQELFVTMVRAGIEAAGQMEGIRNIRGNSIGLQTMQTADTGHEACDCTFHKPRTIDPVDITGFGNGYGAPNDLWQQTVNRTAEFYLLYAQKVKDLLKERAKTAHDTDLKAHYTLLYRKLEQWMNK